MTRKNSYGILSETRELGSDHMEHDYMHIKSRKRSHGFFRNFTVVVKSQMVLFGIAKTVEGLFFCYRDFFLHIQSSMLIEDPIKNTQHYSWNIL